jgi:hypothetical protein
MKFCKTIPNDVGSAPWFRLTGPLRAGHAWPDRRRLSPPMPAQSVDADQNLRHFRSSPDL